ncbi:3-hydroxyacyl-[acyl-carrier-protein] dehydratase [Methylophilaceae bacterium]|nr:3-hydroxyacyl-[acyl-carrier-protein] dehydratase [Methylophilaceae bacterium]
MLLPEVLSVQHRGELSVSLQLHLPAGLHYFPNHFADFPILPGVVQLNWAIHYGHEHLPVTGSFTMMENIKFQSVALPDTRMELVLEWRAEKNHLEFIFADGEKKYSSGRIVFGGTA